MRTLACLLAASLALGSCGLGPPDHVVLGLVAPLSGDRAYLGLEVEDGVRMAVEDLNDEGGLLGRRVALEIRDDSDLVDLPGQLAELAERRRVTAVIGPEAPDVLLGPRNPLSRRDVPALLATGFTGDLTEAATTVVRTVPSARDQVRRLGSWLSEVRRIDRAAVLVADPVEAELAAATLRSVLSEVGLEVDVVVTDPGAPDLRPAVSTLRSRAGDAGAVVLWGPPAVTARATRAVRELGWDAQVAVPSSAFVAEYRTLAEEASEGVVLPFPFREEWFAPEMETWLVRWYRDHGLGALPDLDTLVLDLPVAGLAAYDAVMIVAEAVREAGDRDPARVADALRTVTHDGLLRTYRLGGEGGLEAWTVDDLHVARFHNFATVYDVDPRLDTERQRRFYDYQVRLDYLPDAVLGGPAGDVIRGALEQQRADAPDYVAPRPPPGPVARPGGADGGGT